MMNNVVLNSFQHPINKAIDTLKQVQGDATKINKGLNNN